jgi:amidase
MSNWLYKSAIELARAVRDRQVGCLELLNLHLERVQQHNKVLNAIVVLDAERARARAKEADVAVARGDALGPLHGVPMTVKESFDVAGLPTTWGVPALRDNVATTNASVVGSLLKAGAIVFGKTNVPLYLSDWQSFNAIYGSTSNPWDLTRTPGGSSGGAAASLAAGMSALEIGSDVGSSIRCPAHFCGVYGHKPSYGIVPQRGHWIPGGHVPMDMWVCGPLARSADDLALALELMAGPEPMDRTAWALNLPKSRRSALKDFRIAVKFDDPNCAVDREVTDRLQVVVDALGKAGAKVDDQARPKFDTVRAHELYTRLLRGAVLLGEEAYSQARAKAAQLSPSDKSATANQLRGVVQDHRSWFKAHEAREAVRAAWADFFQDYDVLLCPVASMAAFPHDHRERPDRQLVVNGRAEEFNLHIPGFWAGIATLPYLPATAAPAGRTPGGLPVGVQIVGPYLEDSTTIEFARLLAQITEGFVPPSGYL